MDQRKPEQSDGAVPAPAKSDWSRPEVDRLVAGGAEATDGSDTDGVTLS